MSRDILVYKTPESMVDLAQRQRLALTMAEYFKAIGFTDVGALVPGYELQPTAITGSIRNHQPDVVATQNNKDQTRIIVDTVPVEDLQDQDTESRWTLFASAAQLYGWDFSIAVPRVGPKGVSGPEEARKRLRSLGISSRNRREIYVWAL